MAFFNVPQYQGIDMATPFRSLADRLNRKRQLDLEEERNKAAAEYQRGLIEQQRGDRELRKDQADDARREKARKTVMDVLPKILESMRTPGRVQDAQAMAGTVGGSLEQNQMEDVASPERLQLREPTMQVQPWVGGLAKLGLLPKLQSALEPSPDAARANEWSQGMQRYAQDYGNAARNAQNYTLRLPEQPPMQINPNAQREAIAEERRRQGEELGALDMTNLPENVRRDINLRRMLFGNNVDPTIMQQIMGAHSAEVGRQFQDKQGDKRAKEAKERAYIAARAAERRAGEKPPTEAQGKHALYGAQIKGELEVLKRGIDISDDALRKVQENSLRAEAADNSAASGNVSALVTSGLRRAELVPASKYEGLTPEEQKIANAMDNAVQYIVRVKTGAGMPESEARREAVQMAWHAGDSPELKQQKLERLEAFADQTLSLAGSAAEKTLRAQRPAAEQATVEASAARRRQLQRGKR